MRYFASPRPFRTTSGRRRSAAESVIGRGQARHRKRPAKSLKVRRINRCAGVVVDGIQETNMKIWTRFALVLLFVPAVVASAQFRDLDAAMSNLERGFGSADVDAIVSGIGSDEQVMLQFPGLVEKSVFFGRDQAAYLLD